MKVCISSTGPDLDSQVDPRFGRCSAFIIVDVETLDWESMENEAAGAMGGAGIQVAQAVAASGVEAVITGNVGPNAFTTLSAAGVKIFTGAAGTVKQAIDAFNSGSLSATDQATSAQHSGMGGGGRGGGTGKGAGAGMGGGGRGGGMTGGGPGRVGRGLGMGMGRCFKSCYQYPGPSESIDEDEEINYLLNYENMLKYQIQQIQDRIDQLKK
jgi:predicted Fe-Mo cluster-binding NifX family protein